MPDEAKWLVKSEEETDEAYGKPPDKRTMEEAIRNSMIIIDKQAGPTSHQVTKWVCDIFSDYAKIAGHSGTLDPNVTGVLPVALCNATKAMLALSDLDKEYVGVMHIHKPLPRDVVESATRRFVGRIKQLPPVKSAVARKIREREIYFFDILEMDGQDVLFKVGCQAGTYIRKLIHDVGQALGVGAHMAELRRTKAGNFREEQSHSLVEIRDAYEFWRAGDEKKLRKMLVPVEHALLHLRAVLLKDSTVDPVCNGSPVYASGIARIQDGISAGDLVAVYTLKDEIVALGIARMDSTKMLKAKRDTAVRTDRVFMDRGTYPTWKK